MSKGPVTDKERLAIIEALKSGKSQTATAKEFGRGASTVSRVARGAGLDAAYSTPKKANAARVWFAKQERIALNAELFGRLREMLSDEDLTATELKNLAIAYGILVEKRRLEEGEDTAVSTVRLSESDLHELMRRLPRWAEEHAAIGSTIS